MYTKAVTELLDNLTPETLIARRKAVPTSLPEFDRERQTVRTTAFVNDLLQARGKATIYAARTLVEKNAVVFPAAR